MIATPKIDGRAFRKLAEEVRRIAPHYVPEWKAEDERDPGLALLQVFALIVENVTARLDRAPSKNFVAFLDSLGMSRLPALPSEVPVTFKLTPAPNGTLDAGILIQPGARVIAPATGDRDEDLPFETVSKLLAIPDVSPKDAFLQAAYGVDPSKDSIFAPPPNFLKQAPRTPSALSYQVQAFAAEHSKLLQLNHAIGLEEGSYLRIGDDSPIKAIVEKVEESLAHLERDLERNVTALETAAPILDFEVFNGIDRQEHVLYIGHSELFNIKGRAQITLIVTLGSGPPLTPLSIDWQYWTETEKEGGLWRDLDVADKTNGLSSAGEIILLKTAEEEIKEKEIDGKKSRWIRAKLAEKLLVSDGRAVPQIDRIEIKVSSGAEEDPSVARPCAPFLVECEPVEQASPGEAPESECLANGIPADQLFHNTNPLDPQLDFFPFGTEPRQFDQFYIASQEAFSKKGARITLAMQVAVEMLASPALALGADGLLAYSIGLRRQLYELNIKTGKWSDIADPSKEGTDGSAEYLPSLESRPAAVSKDDGARYVFVRTVNEASNEKEGRIWERIYGKPGLGGTEGSKAWEDLGAPGGTGQIPFDPSAIVLSSGKIEVFVVGNNRQLYSRVVGTDGRATEGDWLSHGEPGNGYRLESAPSAVRSESGKVLVFVTAQDTSKSRIVHVWNASQNLWTALTPSQPFNAASRPFAEPFEKNSQVHAEVFAVDDDGNLRECNTEQMPDEGKFEWINLGIPPDADKLTGDPSGFLENPGEKVDEEGKHIFVHASTGIDGVVKLYERTDNGWNSYESPGDPGLRMSPAAFFDKNTGTPAVVSASKRNSLVVYLPVTGTVAAGNDRIVFIPPPEGGGDYVGKEVHVFKKQEPASDQRKTIEAYDSQQGLAVVDSRWAKGWIPDVNFQCRVLERLPKQYKSPKKGDSDTIHLDSTDIDSTRNETMIEILTGGLKGTRRKVISIEKGVAQVESSWGASPAANTKYSVWRILFDGKAGANADRTIVLDEKAELIAPATGVTLSVPGADPLFQTIEHLAKRTRVAELRSSWTTVPQVGAQYSISALVSTEYAAPGSEDVNPELSWEYWNGRGWLGLDVAQDTTRNLVRTGEVVFELKKDIVIEPTEVAGQNNHWVRARLTGGDYGKEIFRVKTDNINNTQEIIRDRSEINPPKIEKLRICYEMVEGKPPELCLTFNNLDDLDQTSACNTPGAFFQPFVRLPDESKTLYLGFGRTFKGGPVGLLLDAVEVNVDESNPPKLEWKFRKDRTWNVLTVKDDSRALTRRGILIVSPSAALTNETFFGKPLFWIRGALSGGSDYRQPPLLRGIFPNTVRAVQAETITGEIVGSSSGEPNLRFQLQKVPVHQGEEIRVREVLSLEEKKELAEEDKEAFVEPADIPGTWVRWREVADFVECKEFDRCYLIDRASGELRFGDGRRGKVPPADVDNIRSFRYQAGGGKKGNISPGEIKNLATAIAGVESAFNPVEAGGGADTAPGATVPEEKYVAELMDIGPPRLSHRNRAVTPEDFEALAREFSREIAKVRCLPATKVEARGDTNLGPCDENLTHIRLARHGWVSLLVVPRSNERRPCPSLELRRVMAQRLMEQASALLSAGEQIVIAPPDYVIIRVAIDVYARSIEDASEAEGLVRQELESFLHPVNGGPERNGWDFGRAVQASDVYARLEQIETVDRVQNLKFFYQGKESSETVTIPSNSLPASGEHDIRIFIGGET